MPFGLDEYGFTLKRYQDIKVELDEQFKSDFGPEVNLSADSPEGQFIAINSERLASIWELMQSIYNSQYPSSAEGIPLDNVCSLTGISRRPATFSTVTATVSGTPTTIIPAGSIASVEGTGARFETNADVTIGGGGTAQADMTALEAGAVQAPAGTLTVIETAVSGWDSITNAEDANIGQAIETDTELRQRRAASLQVVGAGTVEAIRSRIQQDVDEVTDCYVFENETDSVVSGRPPHSFEAVVAGGDDQEIADKIWEVKPAGIQTHGSETETVTDSQGISHTIKFSRPAEIEVWFHIEIKVGSIFDQGVKQVNTVTVDDVQNLTLYTVTVNGVDYTYTSDATATALEIAAGLVSAINNHGANGWVPVTATDNVDGTFELESDYAGNSFTLTVDSKMSFTEDTASSGDQESVITNVVDFSEDEQSIGDDVFISRYYNPINDTPDIQEITIQHRIDQPYAPPGGAGWNTTGSIVIDPIEVALFDSLRITVEIVT